VKRHAWIRVWIVIATNADRLEPLRRMYSIHERREQQARQVESWALCGIDGRRITCIQMTSGLEAG